MQIIDDQQKRSLTGRDRTVDRIEQSMTLHGVTRNHTVEATLTPTPEGYHVHAAFPLRLSDYDIKPIKRFMLKVKDEIRVEVDLNLVK